VSGSWIAVASAEHVARGRAAGFMQVCHGKGGPLRRINTGDRVAYYSPTVSFGGKDRLQAFTAIGIVVEREPYRVEMGEGFRPFRRDVEWIEARQAPILPLREALDFTSSDPNWGYRLRLGLVPVSDGDMAVIAAAMGARLPG
jgi:EVE domain